jgi:hypothetical protein
MPSVKKNWLMLRDYLSTVNGHLFCNNSIVNVMLLLLYLLGAHDDVTFFPFLSMRCITYMHSYYYLSINPKSSFTVISTTWVLVLSIYGNDRSFFTKLLNSPLLLNFATITISVRPVIS